MWFSLWDVYRYQPISPCAVAFTMRRISVSAHITLCCTWLSLWDVYRYQPILHSVLWILLRDVWWYQSISHSVLWFSKWEVYRYQPISHAVLWFSLWDVYRYHPISHSVLWFSLSDFYRQQPISHIGPCPNKKLSLVRYVRNMPKIKSSCQNWFYCFFYFIRGQISQEYWGPIFPAPQPRFMKHSKWPPAKSHIWL